MAAKSDRCMVLVISNSIPPPPIAASDAGSHKIGGLNVSLLVLFGVSGVVGTLTLFVLVMAALQSLSITNYWDTDTFDILAAVASGFIGLNVFIGIAIFIIMIIVSYRLAKVVIKTEQKLTLPLGLAIGCWFIPLANAILGFLFFSDFVKKLLEQKDQKRGMVFLNLWWWMWIVGVHISYFSMMTMNNEMQVSVRRVAAFTGCVGTLMSVVAITFGFIVFRNIARASQLIESPTNS
jgi:hypothetical protein